MNYFKTDGGTMCKISIIMPVYNKEKYVEKAVESVLNQTYKNFELIIINDGSTDNSTEKCKKYIDDRIVIIDTPNYGVSHARNVGIAVAKGDYITFLDGDDYLGANYLEELFDPSCQMVISGLCDVEKNALITQKRLPIYKGKKNIEQILPGFYEEECKTGIYGFVAGKIIKTSVIHNNKICFDEGINLAEDYDFFLKIFQNINEVCFKQISEYYYYHENTDEFNIKKQDIISQIDLQIKTRKFLKSRGCFSDQNDRLMKEKITKLIYTYIIYDFYNSYYDFLKFIEPIKKYSNLIINIESFYGTLVLLFLKKGNYRLAYSFLHLRQIVKHKKKEELL